MLLAKVMTLKSTPSQSSLTLTAAPGALLCSQVRVLVQGQHTAPGKRGDLDNPHNEPPQVDAARKVGEFCQKLLPHVCMKKG